MVRVSKCYIWTCEMFRTKWSILLLSSAVKLHVHSILYQSGLSLRTGSLKRGFLKANIFSVNFKTCKNKKL